MGRRTFERNQSIILASLNGATTKELARHFNLAQKSVTEIIRNADSLSDGRCSSADLVWLRAVEVAAREGTLGSVGVRVAPLLRSAIIGASRPVMVSETNSLSRDNPAWRSVLSMTAAP
jgi:hypothetical protein